MSRLAQRFRELVSNEKSANIKKEKIADVGYPTGFPNLDILSGSVYHYKDHNGNDKKYVKVGFTDGSLILLLGRSGSGKSTLALQVGGYIVSQFPTSSMFIELLESGAEDSRIGVLLHQTSDEIKNRCIIRNEGITTEILMRSMKIVHDEKNSHRKDYEYDTGMLDADGNPIKKLEPTVWIIDSLVHLFQEDVDLDTLQGNAQGMKNAKSLTAFIRGSIQLIKAANIILICINHILTKVKANLFEYDQDSLKMFHSNETVPGGKNQIYDSNMIYRLDDLANDPDTKLKPESLGFDAKKNDISFVRVTQIKSRSNGDGPSTVLFLDKSIGFDPEWSMYLSLRSHGLITTSGTRVVLEGYDKPFYQKEFKTLIHDKGEEGDKFREAFSNAAQKALTDDIRYIDTSSLESKEEFSQTMNLVGDINNKILGNI